METLSYQQIIAIGLVVWAIVYFILAFVFAAKPMDHKQQEIVKLFCFFWPIVIVLAIPVFLWFFLVEVINRFSKWVDSKI